MLVQRCTLDQHRLIIPVSITKPILRSDDFQSSFSQQHYRALVDTGAQRTVISRSVINELDLMRTGHMQFAGLHGPQTHSRYLAAIALWGRRIDSNATHSEHDSAELSLYVMEEPFEVVDMQENMNFELILGFDVLKKFSFNFNTTTKIFEIILSR